MTRNQRLGLLLLTVAALIVAFIVLRSGSNDDDKSATSPTPPTAPAPAPSPAGEPASPPPAPKPDPGPLLTGSKVQDITVSKGDTVRFRVRSPKADEVHIHGYDIKRDVPAGRVVAIRFKATIDGIFVIEFEGAGKQIASLRVNP